MMNSEVKLLAVLSSLVVLLLLGSYFVMANHEDIMVVTVVEFNPADEEPVVEPDDDVENEVDETVVEEVEPEPINVDSVTGLLMGIDASSGNIDVLMVGHFDADENEFKIVSVPRDLEIDYYEKPFSEMKKSFNKKVSSGEIEADLHQRSYSSVNSVYIDTGRTKAGLYYTRDIVEEITGLEIDYISLAQEHKTQPHLQYPQYL